MRRSERWTWVHWRPPSSCSMAPTTSKTTSAAATSTTGQLGCGDQVQGPQLRSHTAAGDGKGHRQRVRDHRHGLSSFVDHRPEGDILWLSALNHDRCGYSASDLTEIRSGGGCGAGEKAISSTYLKHFKSSMPLPDVGTCNTEVARVTTHSPARPPGSRRTGT